MLKRDSDLGSDLVLLVEEEVEGESRTEAADAAEADAVEDIEGVVEVEPGPEELVTRGDECWLREGRNGKKRLFGTELRQRVLVRSRRAPIFTRTYPG
ncbi:hypothetical protein CORC01_08428 [Colletotrichum orchidophilum]|uniref:Uncharacterized protein n=1 Tax=Colletotrichum orchidophilum TaxID=1209926 RepID=A0A1G4B454_9PEZI|nr:uncharacterized protein CORC01_08428 [Colletotrichum orchidophilum]OHE96210.1 hypothetical protein CORC01_08428 [Colletotrichum orchidophilum]